jgi:hypothetical protein
LDVFTDISGPLGNITQLNTGRNVDKSTAKDGGGFEDDGLIIELQTIRHVLDTVSGCVDLFTVAMALYIILLHL